MLYMFVDTCRKHFVYRGQRRESTSVIHGGRLWVYVVW